MQYLKEIAHDLARVLYFLYEIALDDLSRLQEVYEMRVKR